MENLNYKTTIRKRKLQLLESKYYNYLSTNLEHINSMNAEALNKCLSFERRINATRKSLELKPVIATDIIKANAKGKTATIVKKVEVIEEHKVNMFKRKKEMRERKYFKYLTEMFKDVSKITPENLAKCKLYEDRINAVREALNLPPVTAFDILSVGTSVRNLKSHIIEEK